MKSLFLIFILATLSFSVLATEQEPEIFIYNDHILLTWGLSEMRPYLPIEIGYLIRKDQKGYSTSCYRGYIGTWTLKNDSLYLIKIVDYKYNPLSLAKFFPAQYSKRGVFAEWYNNSIFVRSEKGVTFYGKFKNGILQKEELIISPILKTSFSGNWQNANHKNYDFAINLLINQEKVNGSFRLKEKDTECFGNFIGRNSDFALKGNMYHNNDDTLSYKITVIGRDSLLLKVNSWKGQEYPISIPKEWILTKKE